MKTRTEAMRPGLKILPLHLLLAFVVSSCAYDYGTGPSATRGPEYVIESADTQSIRRSITGAMINLGFSLRRETEGGLMFVADPNLLDDLSYQFTSGQVANAIASGILFGPGAGMAFNPEGLDPEIELFYRIKPSAEETRIISWMAYWRPYARRLQRSAVAPDNDMARVADEVLSATKSSLEGEPTSQ